MAAREAPYAEVSDTPLHDWLRPRLAQLLRDAGAAGFAREAALAVMTDLATAAPFNMAPPPAESPLPAGPWPEPSEAGTIHPVADA